MSAWRRAVLLGVAALAAGLLAGFAGFAIRTQRPGTAPARADGIVVLTGGAGRIELALRLLAEGRAARLLVSGTGRGEPAALLAAGAVGAERIRLGREARSTHGNARETAEWAAAYGMGSLIVVTSGYHMPRALVELRRALPERVMLYPAPLLPHLPDGQDQVPLRLLAAEYGKWLGALAGLSGWAAREEIGG